MSFLRYRNCRDLQIFMSQFLFRFEKRKRFEHSKLQHDFCIFSFLRNPLKRKNDCDPKTTAKLTSIFDSIYLCLFFKNYWNHQKFHSCRHYHSMGQMVSFSLTYTKFHLLRIFNNEASRAVSIQVSPIDSYLR